MQITTWTVTLFNTDFLRLVALCILAGCTAQPAQNHSASKANTAATDVQCHAEQSTVSLVVHTVCTTKAQRDAQQAGLGDVRNVAERPLSVSPLSAH
jgi:hypothetical protein